MDNWHARHVHHVITRISASLFVDCLDVVVDGAKLLVSMTLVAAWYLSLDLMNEGVICHTKCLADTSLGLVAQVVTCLQPVALSTCTGLQLAHDQSDPRQLRSIAREFEVITLQLRVGGCWRVCVLITTPPQTSEALAVDS